MTEVSRRLRKLFLMMEEMPLPSYTLYNPDGEVTGAILGDGEVVWAAPCPTRESVWDEETAAMVSYEVVWCGASRRNDWSKTRGELLGDYWRIPSPPLRGVASQLGVKVATWAKARPQEADDEAGEEEDG
jgi:hypothetical protein